MCSVATPQLAHPITFTAIPLVGLKLGGFCFRSTVVNTKDVPVGGVKFPKLTDPQLGHADGSFILIIVTPLAVTIRQRGAKVLQFL